MTISELYAALQAASEARTTALLNVEAKDKALKAATIDFDAAKATAASAEMTFVSSIDAMIAALQALKPKPA